MATYNRRIRVSYDVLIDLKSGTTTVFIPPRSGAKFMPHSAYAVQETRTGSGSDPQVTIQVVGASFPIVDSIGGAGSIPTATYGLGEKVPFVLNGSSNIQRQDIGTTGISVTVITPSGYTTHTATIVLEGYDS